MSYVVIMEMEDKFVLCASLTSQQGGLIRLQRYYSVQVIISNPSPSRGCHYFG
jgi:hypothetical protein